MDYIVQKGIWWLEVLEADRVPAAATYRAHFAVNRTAVSLYGSERSLNIHYIKCRGQTDDDSVRENCLPVGCVSRTRAATNVARRLRRFFMAFEFWWINGSKVEDL